MNKEILSSPEDKSVSLRTSAEVLHLLFAQSGIVGIGHVLITILYGIWLAPVVEPSLLYTWAGMNIFVALSRYLLSVIYTKYHKTRFSTVTWHRFWTALTVLMSLVYAFAFIVVTPHDRVDYVVGIIAVVFLISGSSALSYAASIYAIASLTIPMASITGIYLIALGSETMLAGSTIVIFAGINLLLVREVNRAFLKSIELNYQNKQEIEKRKLVERQLYEISRRDSLTGLFNRRYFDEMLEVELGRAYRNHSSLSLVLIDIDHFKEYNDHYGHVAGDNCLVNVAHLIEEQTNRKGDLVARYGGEEFAVILPGIDPKGAYAFAKRVQNFIQNQRLEHKSTKLTSLKSITISIGVTSVLPVMKLKPSQLIDQADKALYDAKKEGRNRVKAFSPFGIDHKGLI